MSDTASPSIDADVRFAIANTRLVEIGYGGKLRVAEPHDYGVQRGSEKLLVYQRHASGGKSKHGVTGWRLLDVTKITACRVLDVTFDGSRGPAHQRHYVWDVLYARVT